MSETQFITNQNTLQVHWQQDGSIAPSGQPECTNGIVEVQGEVEKSAESPEPAQSKKMVRHVTMSEAYRYIFARDGALKYAEKVASDALNAKNARDRLSAAQEMTDRVEGKAVQSMRMEQTLDENTGKLLVELANALAPKLLIQVQSAGELPQPIVVDVGKISE